MVDDCYIGKLSNDVFLLLLQTKMATLSEDQQKAFELVQSGSNVFITGPGGTGKSHLIRQIVEWAKANEKEVQVCALTGCAALLLECGAKTVHSWAGIGLANGPPAETIKRIGKHKYKSRPWRKVDLLIIDEVSMMSRKLFEILDGIGRLARKTPQEAFGGIQIVLSGDFYQLPPVGDLDEPDTAAFCFESPIWQDTISATIALTTMFRQQDPAYVKALNEIRVGMLKRSSFDLLCTRVSATYDGDIKPTMLMPLRRHADRINKQELDRLGDAEFRTYGMDNVDDRESLTELQRRTISRTDPAMVEREYDLLRNNVMADKEVIIKVGSQVMCIANIDMEGPVAIVNGSQGIVENFVGDLPMVRFKDGQKRIIGYHVWSSENYPWVGVKQIPLIHAWAITIHKAQGVTLELAEIDAGHNIFECGQTYVALSRVKSLDGLHLSAFDPKKIKVNKKVQRYYASVMES